MKLKKLLSALLAVVLIFAVLPAAARADDDARSASIGEDEAAQLLADEYGDGVVFVLKDSGKETFTFECYNNAQHEKLLGTVEIDRATRRISVVSGMKDVSPDFLSRIDVAHIESLISKESPRGNVSVAVIDLHTGEIVGTSNMDSGMSASMMIAFPILYTADRRVDAGDVKTSSNVVFNYTVSGGRGELYSGSDGKRFALDRLLAIMLRSSDGNAADSLMDFVTRRSINTFCPLDGFESVKVNYHLSKAENGTLQDNFISAADVCRIVETQYNSDGPFGRDFLLLNLTAEDKDTCHGLGRHLIDEADVVMNFYAVVTRLYNEVLIIEDGETAYAVAFMGDSERHVVLEDLASRIGDYVYETLCEN